MLTEAGGVRQVKTRGTLFGQTVGTLIFDEAHNARNRNRLSLALKALVKIAEFSMFLTATPVVTKPEVRF